MSKNSQKVSIRILPDARHECVRCGECCRSFMLGPVHQATVDRLAQEDWEAQGVDLNGEGFTVQIEHEDGLSHYLRLNDKGACIFDLGVGKCAIHTHLGHEAKPWFCQAFPYYLVASDEGLHFGVRPDCPGQHQTLQNGPPLAEHFSSFSNILDRYPISKFPKHEVALSSDAQIKWAAYPVLEDNLLYLIEQQSEKGPFSLAAKVRTYIDELSKHVAEGSASHQADAMDEILDGNPLVPDEGDLNKAWKIVEGLLERLIDICNRTASKEGSHPCRQQDGLWIGKRLQWIRSSAAPTPPQRLSAKGRTLASTHLNNMLFGKGFYHYSSLAAALGAFAFIAFAALLPTEDGGEAPCLEADSFNAHSSLLHRILKRKDVSSNMASFLPEFEDLLRCICSTWDQ